MANKHINKNKILSERERPIKMTMRHRHTQSRMANSLKDDNQLLIKMPIHAVTIEENSLSVT